MAHFLIKLTCVATDKNERYKGMVDTWIYGKRQTQLAHYGDVAEINKSKFEYFPTRDMCYTRRSDAVRSWIYKNVDSVLTNEWWTATAEIIDVEIYLNGIEV